MQDVKGMLVILTYSATLETLDNVGNYIKHLQS